MRPGPVPTPLPSPLDGGQPFTVRTARDADVSADRLRARDLDKVWGVRAVRATPAGLLERCRMFAARMPAGALFSHVTAALLHRIPVPLARERDPILDICLPAPARAPHATGIRGHRLALRRDDVVELDGLRVTSPARTWCDLAALLPLVPLVAAGDHIIHHRLPLAGREVLTRRVADFRGRCVRRLRDAVPLLDDRAESPPETELRVVVQLGGLPRPRINHVLVDTETGAELRTDLAFDDLLFALEYLGDYHRTRQQWRKDMTRRSRLEAAGWYVMELNADDLRNPDELVERIRTVLRRRGWSGPR